MNHYDHPSSFLLYEMEPQLHLSALNNFGHLFESKKNYDVIIQAGEGNDQKEIYAHSIVLCCQSSYFEAAFSNNWAEKRNGMYLFKKPNVLPHVFEIVIRYLYCGQIDLSVISGSDIIKLCAATDELGLEILNANIQKFLIDNKKELLRKDPIEILEMVSYGNYAMLNDSFLEIICQEPSILFGTDKILSLSAQILESLLKREDLVLDEIEVWNDLIKWAHAQQPTVNKCHSSVWTKDELTLMKGTLSRFIPLIKFRDITSQEYQDKVATYEILFPEKLKVEISNFYSVSSLKQIGLLSSRINSVIINASHPTLFVKWIKKGDVLTKVTYKFNLILRGSRDGFDVQTFHAKCDNKGATIVIAKIKGTNQMVGGYNPLDWNIDGFKSTTDSFIFSFNNYSDSNTGRIGRVIMRAKANAVCCLSNFGPIFGRSYDLAMRSNGRWSSTPATYHPNLSIPRNFEIDDYEVFQVIEKK